MPEIRLRQSFQHGVGNAAHACLKRRERVAEAVCLDLAVQEVNQICRHLPEFVIHGGDDAPVIGNAALHHGNHLCGVYLDIGRSDAVADALNRNRFGVRRAGRGVDIVNTLHAGGDIGVDLDDDLFGAFRVDVGGADRGCGDDVAVLVNGGCFDNRHIYRAQELVLDPNGHLPEWHVMVGDLARIDRVPQILVGLVGHPCPESADPRQFAVEFLAERRAGIHGQVKFFALPRPVGKDARNCFRVAGDGKPADPQYHAGADEGCRVLGAHHTPEIAAVADAAQKFTAVHMPDLLFSVAFVPI